MSKWGQVLICDGTDSTMDVAARLAEKRAPAWTTVLALKQNAGRGRLARRWISPSGGIYLSVVLRPRDGITAVPRLGLIMSAATAEFLKDEFGIDAKTKWPNDVLVNEKKISGILTETGISGGRLLWAIMGIGVNLNASPHLDTAISVLELTGRKYPVRSSARKLIKYLRKAYNNYSSIPLGAVKYWIKNSSTPLRRVSIENPDGGISGLAVGIDLSGALVVKTRSGALERVYSGDCIHLR